jgi:hypothetical protein
MHLFLCVFQGYVRTAALEDLVAAAREQMHSDGAGGGGEGAPHAAESRKTFPVNPALPLRWGRAPVLFAADTGRQKGTEIHMTWETSRLRIYSQ